MSTETADVPNSIELTLSTAINENGDALFTSDSPTGRRYSEELDNLMALTDTITKQKNDLADAFTCGILLGSCNALAWVLGNEWLSDLVHPAYEREMTGLPKHLRLFRAGIEG